MRYALLIGLGAVAAHASLSAAQQARDTAHVAAIVVTATRSALAASRSPSSVSVVTGAELRREGVTTVVDALRRVPGIAVVQTGSYGGATSLFIRGGESKFAKVLIDGVPVNDAGGAFDFSSLSTDNVDRIEIVRGPASVLYGSDAMAGVVQLFTRSGAGPVSGDVSVRAGRFGSRDADGGVHGSTDLLTYSLAGARHSTDGIQLFNSQFRQGVGSALVGIRAGGVDAHLSTRYTDTELHYPTNGSGEVVDSNAVHRDDRLSVGLDAGYRLTSAAEVRVSLASYDVHGITDDQPDSRGDSLDYYFTTTDRSRRRSGDARLSVALPAGGLVTVGAQVERQWQDGSHSTTNYGPSVTPPHRRRTTGAYGQILLAPIEPVTVTLGGRLEHNEQFGDFFTYRAAGSAQLAPLTRVHGSIGTSFREPTFLESYGGPFAIGNEALSPEHAMSIDAGIEQSIATWGTVGVTLFSNSFRDLIDYTYSATEPNYHNLARTRTSGAELETRFRLPAGVYADAALTYLDTRVVDPGASAAAIAAFAPDSRLLRRPMHTVAAGIGYRAPRGGVDLRAHHVGRRDDVYFAPDFTSRRMSLDPYLRADLAGDISVLQRTRESMTLTLRIENLFDAHYSDVAGFNADFALRDQVSLANTGYRGAGRRVLSGVRLAF
ncbi:MAG: TonB-dependent receptor [bacterium]